MRQSGMIFSGRKKKHGQAIGSIIRGQKFSSSLRSTRSRGGRRTYESQYIVGGEGWLAVINTALRVGDLHAAADVTGATATELHHVLLGVLLRRLISILISTRVV